MARKLEVIIEAVTKGLEDNLKSAEGRFKRVSHTAGVAGLALAGGLAVGLEKSVHAAMDAQVSQSRLEQAFKSAHLSAQRYEPSIVQVEKKSRLLGFTNEEVRTSLGSLITATGNYTQAQKRLAVAEDLARYKHVSLETATKALTMASAGSTRFLKQLGILTPTVTSAYDAFTQAHVKLITKMDAAGHATQRLVRDTVFLGSEQGIAEAHAAKLKDKQDTIAKAMEIVTQKVHDQAQAYSDTAAGQMAQFRAQMENIQVQIGTALIPIFTKAAAALASLTAFFSEHHKVTKILIIATGALTAALLITSAAGKLFESTLVSRVIPAMYRWLFVTEAEDAALLANPIGAVIVALGALAAALIVLQLKYHAVTTAVDFLRDHYYLLLAVPIIGTTLAIAAAMINNWGRIKDSVGAATDAVIHSIMGVVHVIQTLVSWIMAAVHAVEALISALSRIHVPKVHIPGAGLLGKIPGLAGGGAVTSGGLAMVGEKGPELVSLPSGASVTPMSGGGSGQIVVPLVVDGTVLASVLIDPLRNQAQLIKQRTGKAAFA